jgi:FkbM family methyltransferase
MGALNLHQRELEADLQSPDIDPRLLAAVEGRHGQIVYFARDVGAISRALAEYGEWAANELAFVRQFVPADGTVLDVGAYVGTHTLAFSHWASHVVALESQPTTFQILRTNVRRNGLTNVSLKCAAAGNRCGSMHAHGIDISTEASFGSRSLEEAASQAEGAISDVPVITIDSLGLQRCDVMKIDVEGMESAVIAGSAETIGRYQPVIYAECNSVEAGADSLRVMRELGYEVRLHVVDAFAADNFFGNPVNIFGPAREAALVGVPAGDPRLETVAVRSCELLVRIETLDDLVLGLLNKPQYPGEILQPSAAARSGGDVWLAEYRDLRSMRERLEAAERKAAERSSLLAAGRAELATARQQASELQARVGVLEAEAVALEGELRAVRDDLARADEDAWLLRLEVADQAALAQAAATQVALGQQASKASERRAGLADRGLAAAAVRNAALEVELVQARAAFVAIEASTCWRMTNGLRRLVDRFRH